MMIGELEFSLYIIFEILTFVYGLLEELCVAI